MLLAMGNASGYLVMPTLQGPEEEEELLEEEEQDPPRPEEVGGRLRGTAIPPARIKPRWLGKFQFAIQASKIVTARVHRIHLYIP